MDYDRTRIPEAYDRARDHGPEVLDLWMDRLAAQLEGRKPQTILDLGCGTGRFTEALANRFGAAVVGIDPSKKMLEQARAKVSAARVRYELGCAEAIPLSAGSVDVVLMSMCFHHFTDPKLAARECRRVLADGGRVFVRTGTREQIASFPYLPFFPKARPLLDQTLPDEASLREVFEAADFRLLALELVTQTVAPDWAAFADKLAAGGDSVLARLSARDFETGIAKLRGHAAHAHGPVAERVALFVFR